MKVVDKITKKALKKAASDGSGLITKKSSQPVITSMKIID